MKAKYIIGIAIIVIFAVFGAMSFKKTLTPYVSFEEAKRTGANVQVIGKIAFSEVEYDLDSHQLRFPIMDETGQRMVVTYGGPKPANFEQAEEVVVIGRHANESFNADQLLVKCPSKYQGSPEGDSVEVEHPESIPKDSL
jgi:cytochrome c-type biogenesis protein CcmE